MLFFGTIGLAFAFSFFVPVFAYFRLLFLLAPFYLILAAGIMSLNWIAVNRILLGLMLSVNIVSAVIYFSNPKFQREDWKAATQYVINNSDKNTVVLFESTAPIAPFDYYGKQQVEAYGVLDSFSPVEEKVSQNVQKNTEGKKKVFLFQYLSEITDPYGFAFKNLNQQGFTNVSTKDFNGVGFVYEFQR
jgi:hypothetical protein